jgi:hydrogenase maturation factor
MASIYEIEKMIDAINAQVKVLCEMVGVDPMPMPNEDTPTEDIEPSA